MQSGFLWASCWAERPAGPTAAPRHDVLSGNILPPDIQMQSVVAAGAAGVTMTYKIANSSPAPFGIGMYGAGNRLLDTVLIDQAADRTVGVLTKTYTIGTAAGQVALPGLSGCAETDDDYYIAARADHLAQIAETNESNNTAYLKGAYQAGSTVFVHGTTAADTLAMAVSGTNLNVTLNGTTRSFAAAGVGGLRVRPHAGNDTVTGSTLAKPIWRFSARSRRSTRTWR